MTEQLQPGDRRKFDRGWATLDSSGKWVYDPLPPPPPPPSPQYVLLPEHKPAMISRGCAWAILTSAVLLGIGIIALLVIGI